MKSKGLMSLAGSMLVGSMLLSACGDAAATSVPQAGATAGSDIATVGAGASTAVTGAGNAAGTAAAGAGTAISNGAATVGTGAGTAAAGAGTAISNGAATVGTGAADVMATTTAAQGMNQAGAMATGTAMAGNMAMATMTAGSMMTGTMAGGTATPAGSMGGNMTAFDPKAVKKADVEAGATIRISGGGSTAEQEQFKQQLARFAQVYPDVKVNYEPNPEGYNDKLKAQFTSNTQPDVFNFEPGLTDDLISSNKVLDLAPYLAAAGRAPSDYFPGLIAIYQRGDKVYGLPRDFNSLMVFYNTDLLAKAGATAPKDGWTQADFAAFAKAMTNGTEKATKVYGTDTEADYARFIPFALANGAKIMDNGKCAINSPAAVDSLNYWYGLWKAGNASQKSDVGAGWAGEAFAKQRAASAIEGGWLVPFMSDPKGGFQNIKYDVAPLPVGKDGGKGNYLFTNAWGGSAGSKFPKATAALIMFLTGRENEQQVLQSGFALPSLKGFDNDPFFQGTGFVNKVAKVNYASGAYGIADYYGASTSAIQKALSKALEQTFAGTDAKTALDSACKSIDAEVP